MAARLLLALGATTTPAIDQKGKLKMPATVWKGFISFGLVSFPVRLFSAARAETVHFHMLHKKDQSRVKEVWYRVKENKPIGRADIEKGFEVAKGEYVVVEDEELKENCSAHRHSYGHFAVRG